MRPHALDGCWSFAASSILPRDCGASDGLVSIVGSSYLPPEIVTSSEFGSVWADLENLLVIGRFPDRGDAHVDPASPAGRETLWDEVLPIDAKVVPDDLAKSDELPSNPELPRPIAERWRVEAAKTGRAVLSDGRPTIPMETYVRLMVVK